MTHCFTGGRFIRDGGLWGCFDAAMHSQRYTVPEFEHSRKILPWIGSMMLGFCVLFAGGIGVLRAGDVRTAQENQAAGEEMPVFQKGARILFQGDSITDGGRNRSGADAAMFGSGYQFIIAARYGGRFAGRALVFMNRGVGGDKVTELRARWKKDTLDLKPDILSILVGVNDSAQALAAKAPQTIEEFETTYAQILDDALAANPGIKFVLCEPFVLPVGGVKNRWEDWRREIRARAAVVEKLAAKHKAPVVHFQKLFDDACSNAPANYWTLDGVHPTFSGHQLMADEWIRAVGKFWPEAAK